MMNGKPVRADLMHDMKVSLQLITSCAALLEEEKRMSRRGRDCLRMLKRSARELERAVLRGVEEGEGERDVVGFARRLAGEFAIIAGRKGVRMVFRENVACFRMRVDMEKLRRILSNLFGNALRYTPEGGRIILEARLLGDAMEFSMEDTGSGIAEEMRERIFERGVSDGGTGHGLAIVRELAGELGGRVWVEAGAGGRFVVRIPVKGGGA